MRKTHIKKNATPFQGGVFCAIEKELSYALAGHFFKFYHVFQHPSNLLIS